MKNTVKKQLQILTKINSDIRYYNFTNVLIPFFEIVNSIF